MLIFLISFSLLLPQQIANPQAFNQANEIEETYFYKTLKKYAPEYELDTKDKKLFRKAEKKFPRLYSYLKNFYFYSESPHKTGQEKSYSYLLSLSIKMAKELLQSVSLKHIQKEPSPLNSVLTSSGYYSRKNSFHLL